MATKVVSATKFHLVSRRVQGGRAVEANNGQEGSTNWHQGGMFVIWCQVMLTVMDQ